MSGVRGPTPAEQIAFLGNIERLLSEGQFVATYKYALLVSIANLAVQLGSDDGRELDLSIRLIAEQFIELYWRHSAPYGASLLLQNTGKQAAMIGITGQLRAQYATLTRAKESSDWKGAVTQTAQLIEKMPLWRLQVLRAETLEFLYSKSPERGCIRLHRGVAANLRRFYSMILRLAQSEWLHFIQALPDNAPLLGATSDLGEFLFGAERTALAKMGEPLADVQHGACLYCERRVGVGEIDHFIPWSRYPRDLAHNLVLAHKNCNQKKSDLIAAEAHLERWLQRNSDETLAIGEAGRMAGIVVDLPATMSVATWVYSHAARVRAASWIEGDTVEPLSGRWHGLLLAS